MGEGGLPLSIGIIIGAAILGVLILAGFVGGDAAGGGGISPSFSKSAGASSTTQRTLTIIIKFDEENKVRDFAYRQSTF